MKVLLSIKPEFVDRIFSGEKLYEFRKTCFSRTVTSVVVYSTYPVGLLVGEFEVGEIIESNPVDLWELTKKFAGISRALYFEYFSGKKRAVAIQIKRTHRYRKAINPYTRWKNFSPPQSFRYLDDVINSEQMSFLHFCPT